MSLKLFTAILEYAFKTLDWENFDIKIEGKKQKNLRFADDIVLITDISCIILHSFFNNSVLDFSGTEVILPRNGF